MLIARRGSPRRTAADMLATLRRSKLLIGAFALGCALIAVLISSAQDEEYVASAEVSFHDVLADLQLVGTLDAVATEIPLIVRANRSAALLERDSIVDQVRKRIKTKLSSDELAEYVEADVDPETAFLAIEATAPDAEFAARIANGFAEVVEQLGDEQELERLEAARTGVLDQIKRVKKDRLDKDIPTALELRLQATAESLRSLIEVADPVEIEARATPPEVAATRAPVRNGIIGFGLGFLLGCVAALMRAAVDRRVHTVEEIAAASGLPVLARVRNSALGRGGIARAAKRPISDNDFEAFRSLRANLSFLATDGVPRSILVTSGSAEEGKSTVSAGLAGAGALAGQRVLLIECDMRRPALAERLGARPGPGLSEYLTGDAEPRDILQLVDLRGAPESAGGEPTRLVLISAGRTTASAAELLMNPRFSDLLEKVGHVYDLIVLDGGPLLSVADPLEIVPLVDGVVLCARAGSVTREQLKATVGALRNLPQRPAGVVVTGIRSGGPDGYEYYG